MALRYVLQRSVLGTVREAAITINTGFGAELGPAVAPMAEGVAAIQFQQTRWASKKQGGSTQNNKDSQPKFLGVKLYGGERCTPGNIIVRQRGTKFHPGENVGIGKDHTIYSLINGNVQFSHDKRRRRTYIDVKPVA